MTGAEIFIGIIVSAISVCVGAIGKTFTDKRKLKDEATLSANDQALLMYKGLLDRLEKQLNQLTIDQNKLELDHLATREANVELRITNKYLTEENKRCSEELIRLRSLLGEKDCEKCKP